jgi:hypothetical protein
MSLDYKIKKYNYKIIEAIKNNENYKIPDYLQHTSFYLKGFLSNSFKGGKPQTADLGLNPDVIGNTLGQAARELAALGERLRNARAARAADVGDKDRTIDELRAELLGVRDELARINEEIRVLREERDRIQAERDGLRAERDGLQAENAASAAGIRDRDLQLEEINQRLRDSVALRDQLTAANAELTQRIDVLNATNVDLTGQNNALTGQNNALTGQNNALTGQNVDLTRRLNETQASRQETYNAGLKTIREFRNITIILNGVVEDQNIDLLQMFHVNDVNDLMQHWSLTQAAADYVMSAEQDPVYPNLNAI